MKAQWSNEEISLLIGCATIYAEYALGVHLEPSILWSTDIYPADAILSPGNPVEVINETGAVGAGIFGGLLTKVAARRVLQKLQLPSAQAAAANRAIGRATSSSTIDIILEPDHSLIVSIKRPGANGYQVIESTIMPDGTKSVIQKAYDASGNLDHFDPKTP